MKKKSIVIVCYLLLTLCYTKNIAFAEKDPFYIGFSIFHSMESMDEGNSEEKFTKPVNISLSNSNGLQLRGGVIFNELLSGEASIEFIKAFEDNRKERSSKVDVINTTFNCKVKYYLPAPIQPYGIIGIGILNTREDTRLNNDSSSLTDWGMSLRFGMGVDLFITPVFSAGLETTYSKGMGNVDHIQYINISLGMNYKF